MYPALIEYQYEDANYNICIMAGVFASDESWKRFLECEKTYRRAKIGIVSRKKISQAEYESICAAARKSSTKFVEA